MRLLCSRQADVRGNGYMPVSKPQQLTLSGHHTDSMTQRDSRNQANMEQSSISQRTKRDIGHLQGRISLWSNRAYDSGCRYIPGQRRFKDSSVQSDKSAVRPSQATLCRGRNRVTAVLCNGLTERSIMPKERHHLFTTSQL